MTKAYWSDVSKCGWHKPHKLSYVQFHDWAERRIKRGDKQRQCMACLCWFFDDEWGMEPTPPTEGSDNG